MISNKINSDLIKVDTVLNLWIRGNTFQFFRLSLRSLQFPNKYLVLTQRMEEPELAECLCVPCLVLPYLEPESQFGPNPGLHTCYCSTTLQGVSERRSFVFKDFLSWFCQVLLALFKYNFHKHA